MTALGVLLVAIGGSLACAALAAAFRTMDVGAGRTVGGLSPVAGPREPRMPSSDAHLSRGPRLPLRYAALATTGIVGTLLFANLFAHQIVPHYVRSLWGPYFVAGLGWLLAAGVAGVARALQDPVETEREADQREILQLAVLVGSFLVAAHLVLGFFAGYGRSPLDHSPRWLVINLGFALAPLLAVESSRAALLRVLAPRNVTFALVATSLGLAALRLPAARFMAETAPGQAAFWGATFIPLAATGLLAGFYTLYGGLRAGLLVTAPLVLFQHLSPALPVASWPVMALVGVGAPAMAMWVSDGLLTGDDRDAQAAVSAPGPGRVPSTAWVVTAVAALAIFWFSFGFFGFRPAFIPSYSMEPTISRGDMVLVGPVAASEIRVGDVIMYRSGSRAHVLHRVVDIVDGATGREFITQGDNNNTTDLFPVPARQVEGRLVARIPYAGWLPMKTAELLGWAR